MTDMGLILPLRPRNVTRPGWSDGAEEAADSNEAMANLMDLLGLGTLLRTLRDRLMADRSRRKLEALKDRAAGASASFRPQYNLRAARLAASMGQDDQALTLYGNAIDGYLEAGRDRAAEVACRQVVDRFPHVVRARRTLALIALGRGDTEEATALLEEYAEAAKQYGDDQLIRKSLRTIGLISKPGPVRSRAAAELSAVGDDAGAQLVLESEDAFHDELVGGGAGTWSKALQAALLGADEMRRDRPV